METTGGREASNPGPPAAGLPVVGPAPGAEAVAVVAAAAPGAPRPATAATWALRGLFALALVFAVREAKPLLAPVAVAVVLTFVLAPAVRWLRGWGVPEVGGAALVVLALLAATVPLATGLAQPAAQWWEKAPTTLNHLLTHFDRVRAAIPGLGPPAAHPAPARSAARNAAAAVATPPADPVKERLASEGVALTGVLLGRGVSFTVAAASTLILLYFLLASEHWMLSRVVEAVPGRRTRALVLGGVRSAQREISRYLFVLSCINAGNGLVTGVSLWALGLPNPVLWGVIVAVLCFIPYLGPMLMMGLLLLAGMATFDRLFDMLAPAMAFMVIHGLEANLLSPWFVGRRLSLSPISVFLSVMFWGWLWGIAGALIAVPLLIALRSVCLRTRRLKLASRLLEGGWRAPPTLRSLLRRPRPAAATAVPRRGRRPAP